MGLEAPCDSWLTLASGLYLSPRTGEALRLGRAALLWMTNSGVDSGLVHYEKKDSNFDISPLQKLVTKQYKTSDRFLIAELILSQCVQEAIPTCEAVSALLRTMSPNHNNCTTIYRTFWSHNTQSWLWNLHEISDGFVKIGYPEIHSFISCYIEFEFMLSYFIIFFGALLMTIFWGAAHLRTHCGHLFPLISPEIHRNPQIHRNWLVVWLTYPK